MINAYYGFKVEQTKININTDFQHRQSIDFWNRSPVCSIRSRAPAVLHMAMSLCVFPSRRWIKYPWYHQWVKVQFFILNAQLKFLEQSGYILTGLQLSAE